MLNFSTQHVWLPSFFLSPAISHILFMKKMLSTKTSHVDKGVQTEWLHQKGGAKQTYMLQDQKGEIY